MILMFILFFTTKATFYSDSNYVLWSQADNLICWGYYRARSYYFASTFDNVPKLILTMEQYESTPNDLGVNFNLVALDNQKFTLGMSCSGPTLYTFGFRWIAIDSEELFVINAFNTNPSRYLTYPHSNPHVNAAFVSLFIFGYTGEVNFQIQVIELNSTHVTVETTNIANLRTLGFQIIMGPVGMIKQLGVISASSPFNSPFYEIQPNSYFITPFQGFWHIPDTQNINIKHTQTKTSTNIFYASDSPSNSYYVNNIHLIIWIIKQPEPAQCTTLRITQIKDLQAEFRPKIQISLPELQLFYKVVGQYSLKLTTSQLVTNIQIHAKCFKNKKYLSQFNKCNSCANKRYHSFTHNCYGAINTLIYTARFTQTMVTNQQLVLYVNDSSCKITQLIQSQVLEEVIILQVQQFDI
ncbi:unnamed protein product [Paramecium pentaurelia]|uniref:H-type lectin domain-containing protein n=1 Tax=Paramecium pentaurelia TaxID=43138 RepID=A0A8S1UEI5_9CILI|nr:unnamed protein product [Paramecium pentaurelia]